MMRWLLALMVLGSVQALTAQTEPPKEEPLFEPAEAQSVTDVIISYLSIANGTVVLDAVISETGKVQTVEVRRDIGSVTEPAVAAVKEWQFSPAKVDGKPIVSRVPVAVNVRPPLVYVEQIPFPPLIAQTEDAIQAEFQSAEVTRAAFPRYPSMGTPNLATVTLDVALDAEGKAGDMKVLSDVSSLSEGAVAAVADWRFRPATLNGRAVPSRIVLVFVFRAPTTFDP